MVRLFPDVTTEPFVDGLGVVQYLLKAGLPSPVHVLTKIPDGLRVLVGDGVVVIRRAGGQSVQPEYHSRFSISLSAWASTDQAAYLLCRSASTVLFTAQKDQTVTPLGWITSWAESSGAQDTPDPGLPEYGRYVAVLNLLIRNPRGV